MKKQVIDKETALSEFLRFGEEMELDFDRSSMNEDELDTFQHLENTLVKAVMNGSLIFDEQAHPIFTPQRSGDVAPLKFREPTGATLMSMDKKRKNEDVGRQNAVMAELAKVPPVTFAKMSLKDYKVCQSVVTLFLGQ